MTSFRVVQEGDTIAGRYQLVSKLGEGGRSVVYRALDNQTSTAVALKALRPGLTDVPEVAARFSREARIAHELKGPHIVSALDMGASDGVMYYTSELIEGRRLDHWLEEHSGPVQPDTALEIMHQLLETLGDTHRQGVIHRDLRPSKIYLTRTESCDHHVHLMDFGMALRKESDPLEAQISTVDRPLGSMAYLAPEQIIGGEVTERTDIYAAGHILFELLAGHRVYEDLDLGEIARLKIRGSDPTLGGPPLRGSLGPAIARATALDSARRYESCWLFIGHLHTLRRMASRDITTDAFPIPTT